MYCPLLSCNIISHVFFYYLAVSSEGLGLHHIAIMTLCGGGDRRRGGFNFVMAEVSHCDIVDICMAIPDEM